MPRIQIRPPWQDPGLQPTPEDVFLNRREWLRLAGFTGLGALGLLTGCEPHSTAQTKPAAPGSKTAAIPAALRDLYPAKRNAKHKLDRDLTDESVAADYVNFYEFDANSKTGIAELTKRFVIRPWEIEITGLVKKSIRIDVDELTRKMGLEERLYRFRCVEAWAMAVPWTGFPMKRLIDFAQPLGSAKFIRFVSFLRPDQAPGQKNKYFQWPYYEALRLDEARNDLAMIVTGIYGKPLPKQHGAPLRAVVPWKYGYKGAKSIVKIEFTENQPPTFWNDQAPREYGFLSNVDPRVPHPRWSQVTERIIGTNQRRPTLLYNGYAEHVAQLYES